MKNILAALIASIVAASTFTAFADETGVPTDYPLKKCPISGVTLGEHGKPFKASHEGTEVFLCCKGCMKDFVKEPAKYAQAVKDAKK